MNKKINTVIQFCLSVVLFTTLSFSVQAADVPKAEESVRAQYVKDYAPSCVSAIEAKPDLRVRYSHKTIQAFCVCREQYEADVATQALKEGRRGKAVKDEIAAYQKQKCSHILLNNLEHE